MFESNLRPRRFDGNVGLGRPGEPNDLCRFDFAAGAGPQPLPAPSDFREDFCKGRLSTTKPNERNAMEITGPFGEHATTYVHLRNVLIAAAICCAASAAHVF